MTLSDHDHVFDVKSISYACFVVSVAYAVLVCKGIVTVRLRTVRSILRTTVLLSSRVPSTQIVRYTPCVLLAGHRGCRGVSWRGSYYRLLCIPARLWHRREAQCLTRLVPLLLVGLGEGLAGHHHRAGHHARLLVVQAHHAGEVGVGHDNALLALLRLDEVLAVTVAKSIAAHQHVRHVARLDLVRLLTELLVLLVPRPTGGGAIPPALGHGGDVLLGDIAALLSVDVVGYCAGKVVH